MNPESYVFKLHDTPLLVGATAMSLLETQGINHLITAIYNFTNPLLNIEAERLGDVIAAAVTPDDIEGRQYLEALRRGYGDSNRQYAHLLRKGEISNVSPIARVEARLGKYATHNALAQINAPLCEAASQAAAIRNLHRLTY